MSGILRPNLKGVVREDFEDVEGVIVLEDVAEIGEEYVMETTD